MTRCDCELTKLLWISQEAVLLNGATREPGTLPPFFIRCDWCGKVLQGVRYPDFSPEAREQRLAEYRRLLALVQRDVFHALQRASSTAL